MVRKQRDVDFFTPEVIAEPYPVSRRSVPSATS